MIVYVLFLHSVLLIHIFFKIFKYLFAKKKFIVQFIVFVQLQRILIVRYQTI